ncbi:MAG: amidohydrolase/deacetylase family metallohydrolase, partial [Thermoflexales bacterium]
LQGEVGTLRPGAYADVALFKLCEGDYVFYDVFMNARKGRRLLCNTLTIVNGQPMARAPDGPTMPWIAPSEDQRALVARGHTPTAMARGCCA